ncbi:hypothetical protein ASE01_09620 [Nocardioides sp. Root190]|uniref:hypothetical protein n=1 Tax=Nocardioides sp. Root190 TaxID=1736488 RepID=UPI0006FA096C|nr:hypothetical protein [Nocardioides sp. Root190]KRB77012.1 hypothetical protein ASE01_09620 [Nocardioides sp. Root190]
MFEFTKLLDPVALGAAAGAEGGSGASGLAIVEEEVNKTIKALTEELAVIRESSFQQEGNIATASFGQGNEANSLATEHARAHGVVVLSLEKVMTDLETFLESIQEAKRLIRESDEDAEVRLHSVLVRTEDLDLGWTSTDGNLPDAANEPEGTDV